MLAAARAIVVENGKILVMHRDKNGSQYFTLVGGGVDDGETAEQSVVREVMEETGLQVTSCRLVYIEKHDPPYNQQYIYLCEVAPHAGIAIQEASEEAILNRLGANTHTPLWAEASSFAKLPFRTPQLQIAITQAIKHGFPTQPVNL